MNAGFPLLLLFAAATVGPVVIEAPDGADAPDTAWIAEAVADALPRALGLLSVPVVERADLRQAQQRLGFPRTPVTRASAIRVAEAFGASRLVTGTYEVQDDTVTLSLRLLDLERATLSAPLIAKGPLTHLLDLVGGLAWDVTLAGPTEPGRTRDEFLALQPQVPLEAIKAYARGLASTDPVAGAKLLRRALVLRPGYEEARLALGRLQLGTREYEGARDTLARVGKGSPLARPARFLEGVALLDLARYAEAAELYAGLVAREPSASALNNQAVALLRLGGSSLRASAVFRQAFEQDQDALDTPFNIGFALLAEGDADAAAFWLQAAAARNPRDGHGLVVLAWALRAAGREAAADDAWRRAIALSSSYQPLATADLTRRFERARDSEGSLAREAEERNDDGLAATHLARGEALLARGKVDEALAELGRAAYLDPTNPRVHLLLGRMYRARGESDKARAAYRMSLWAREDEAVRREMGDPAPVPRR